jgi:hypothetical protein
MNNLRNSFRKRTTNKQNPKDTVVVPNWWGLDD